MNLDEARTRATLTVRETADLLGMGLNGTYTMVNSGDIPGLLKLGRKTLVKAPELLRWLGDDPPAQNDAPGGEAEGVEYSGPVAVPGGRYV